MNITFADAGSTKTEWVMVEAGKSNLCSNSGYIPAPKAERQLGQAFKLLVIN
ncbi:MAG: hypothetical protein U0T81_02910 [Saprospiraceae bacterium]